MSVISKKNLLRGIGSVLEVFPTTSDSTAAHRVQVLKTRNVKVYIRAQKLDSQHLQSDWERVGEYLGHAVKSYDQKHRSCT